MAKPEGKRTTINKKKYHPTIILTFEHSRREEATSNRRFSKAMQVGRRPERMIRGSERGGERTICRVKGRSCPTNKKRKIRNERAESSHECGESTFLIQLHTKGSLCPRAKDRPREHKRARSERELVRRKGMNVVPGGGRIRRGSRDRRGVPERGGRSRTTHTRR